MDSKLGRRSARKGSLLGVCTEPRTRPASLLDALGRQGSPGCEPPLLPQENRFREEDECCWQRCWAWRRLRTYDASLKRIAQTGHPVGVGGINGFAQFVLSMRTFRRVAPDQSSVMCRMPRLARRLPDNLSTQRLTMAVGRDRHGVRSTVRGGVQKSHCPRIPFSRTGVPARVTATAGVPPSGPER
jgi:hypothetical protein